MSLYQTFLLSARTTLTSVFQTPTITGREGSTMSSFTAITII